MTVFILLRSFSSSIFSIFIKVVCWLLSNMSSVSFGINIWVRYFHMLTVHWRETSLVFMPCAVLKQTLLVMLDYSNTCLDFIYQYLPWNFYNHMCKFSWMLVFFFVLCLGLFVLGSVTPKINWGSFFLSDWQSFFVSGLFIFWADTLFIVKS